MKIGILWDLDGTLLNTLQDLTDATNYALRTLGYPERSIDEVRRFVGNGALRLFEQAVPAGVDPAPALAVFRTYYDAHCLDKTAPYPGIPAALKALVARYPMAIVSNKPDSAVKALCAEIFPGIYARGESAGCPRKPAPDMVHAAAAAIGADTCIYVGDSEVDILTAQNAGVPCLSVLWGFRDRKTLVEAGAETFCKAPGDLPAVLCEMIEKEGTCHGQ